SRQLNFVFRLIVNTIIPSNIRIELPNKLVISGEITVRMRWPIVIDKLTIVPDASMMIRSAGSVNRISRIPYVTQTPKPSILTANTIENKLIYCSISIHSFGETTAVYECYSGCVSLVKRIGRWLIND